MADLSVKYLGLQLRNPLIAGSSGLTKSPEKIIELEKKGIGAVVLKSLFEEQIRHEVAESFNNADFTSPYPEAEDYISNYSRDKALDDYLTLISKTKKSVNIPVIASVNCVSAGEWTQFAAKIQDAGADAMELNIFILPSDINTDGVKNEEMYFEIIRQVRKTVSIPVAAKLSYYFSGLAKFMLKLSWDGVEGLVLFNRFFSPDFDIEKMELTSGHVFSHPEDLSLSLRWVAMLSDRVYSDISASTGIHDSSAVIKQLLAGAKTVQLCSTLYKNGLDILPAMISDLEKWMDRHQFKTIEDFRGKLSYKKADNPAPLERVQFMKYFAGIE